MAKYFSVMLLFTAALVFAHGQDFDGLTTYLKPEMHVGPKPLNGHDTSVMLTSWDEEKGNDDKARLYIYVQMTKESPSLTYAELKIEALDEAGKAIKQFPTETNEKTFERIHDMQCGVCWLQLNAGQKVTTIRITWNGSVQTFPLSEAKIIRPSLTT